MAKHRKFNADRFLDKLLGNEKILRDYTGQWPKCRAALRANFEVEDFKAFLASDEIEGKDDLVEGLYRVFDLSTEQGHEYLVNACSINGCNLDPESNLPVECLGLKVLTENEDAFHLAYDMYGISSAERFAIYRGRKGQTIADPEEAAKRVEEQLAAVFKDHKRSDRVIVRQFSDGQRNNLVVYHEKRTKAHLVFSRTRGKKIVRPHIFRPAQQDLICYDPITGIAEIEAGFEKEEGLLRRTFAGCCLGNQQLFEDDHATDLVDLSPIQNERFDPRVDEGHSVFIVELQAKLGQGRGPTLIIKSKNVLHTLSTYRLYRLLAGAEVRRVTVKFLFGDDKRGRRVEILPPNRLKFRRATHADLVFHYLRRWGLIRG